MKSKKIAPSSIPGVPNERAITLGQGQTQMSLQCPDGITTEHAAGIAQCGLEVLQSVAATGEKYLNLCKYIRTNQVAPRGVSEILKQMGFAKQRIAEINRVAQVPDDMWKPLEAKQIGFRETLELSRGTVNERTARLIGAEVVQLPPDEPEGEVEGGAESVGNPDETPEQKVEREQATAEEKMGRAAKTLLRSASILGFRQRTFANGSDYEVIIRKSKKLKAGKSPKE